MKKKIIINSFVSALVLGSCAVPFLPITQHIYLKSYNKTVKLGAYEIDARIILSENTNNNDMRISGYFEYPATELLKDGCYIEVSVEIEGHTTEKYPAHVINTKHERNFPVEKFSDNSLGKSSYSDGKHRLDIMLYNEPLVEQLYILNLKPIAEKDQKSCTVTKTIKHKVRRARASMFDAAMSV